VLLPRQAVLGSAGPPDRPSPRRPAALPPGGPIPRPVVLLSAAWPYPVDSGKRVVLSGFVEYFRSTTGAADLHYVHVGSPPEDERELAFTVHRVPTPRPTQQLAGIAWHAVARRDRSVQEAVLLGRDVREHLARVLREIGPALQVFDTVRMAQYAGGLPVDAGTTRVVYLDDLFSVRYGRMLEAMAARPDTDLNVLGEFGSVVPAPLRALAGRRTVQRAVLRLERRLVARSEDRAARSFQRSLLVNSQETRLLRERAGVDSVRTVRPLLTTPAAARPRRYDGRPEFVFLGLLTLPHNDVAVRSFLRTQMPALLDAVPGARLRVVGRGAGAELQRLAAGYGDAVSLEGWVPDLDEVLSAACAMVNPLLFGTGIKLKVLEALVRGLPVVSTRTGVEGVAEGPAHGCLVEDDVDRHPELLRSLIDRERNAELSAAALAHYRSEFSPAAVRAVYDEVFAPAPSAR
jgi:glycosyltransferase involved in cell wall biosynthesis